MNHDAYRVSVEEYVAFRRDGYLVVRELFLPEEIDELRRHADDLMHGRIEVEEVPPPPPGATLRELETRLVRIHMLHRKLEIHERYLLHSRLLDVLEALIGPDVLAMQTMLFLKGPGAQGQGYHQDSYYIPTFPDSLCGAWVALDRADEENGCLRMAAGSQVEPIYPPATGYGYGNRELADIPEVSNVGGAWNDDENEGNGLKPVAGKYADRERPVILDPGDVAFFGGHVLHRSLTNRSSNRMRRAFVTHYCNARSFTPWLGGNGEHILARGATSLPYARPQFGTPCAANRPERSRADDALKPSQLVASDGGMEAMPADDVSTREHH